MRFIKPSVEFIWMTHDPLQMIERAGRTCYKSEGNVTVHSAEPFVRRLITSGHEAMIEHASASYRVTCDRGVTHEIVRHRLFSYAQESTRYCNYKGGVTFIIPPWLSLAEGTYSFNALEDYDNDYLTFLHHLHNCEQAYMALIKKRWTPQQARSVLPNALKTEIVITGNFREWRHFFKLRTVKSAHPQMQEIANMLLNDIRKRVAVVFDDLKEIGNGTAPITGAQYLADEGRSIFTGCILSGLWNARCMDACIMSRKPSDEAAYELLLKSGDQYILILSADAKLRWQSVKDKAAESNKKGGGK